jgi:hypothetical protein
MSSPLLERHLGEICQHIYGVGGTRSGRLFAAVAGTLSTFLLKSDTTSLRASDQRVPLGFNPGDTLTQASHLVSSIILVVESRATDRDLENVLEHVDKKD